jgi:hypothetical protein
MKTLNVSQFYNGFCCYFQFTCFSFDKISKVVQFDNIIELQLTIYI